jgi:hypothetical protein
VCKSSQRNGTDEFLEILFRGWDADEGLESIIDQCYLQGELGEGKTNSPVALKRGQMELMRICLSPYSDASPLVAFATAALLALYQTRPGLGREAPMDAILIIEPPSP